MCVAAQRRCATYSHKAPLTPHHHQRPLPSPLPLFPHRALLCFPLLFPNQVMEEELTLSHQINPTLAGDQWRTREGRRRRAPPPPRPPLSRRRPRRRTSPSFFFIFPKLTKMNSTRSTPTLLYSNKWPLARALLIAGELPSPFHFLLCPHIQAP